MSRPARPSRAPVAVPAASLLDGLPAPWPRPVLADIRRLARGRPVVVLDDDPTGTQTVRDVPVVTVPDPGELIRLVRRHACVFVLTNSRSLVPEDAAAVAERVGHAIRDAQAALGRPVGIISRSDSTLRGHFPLEVDIVARAAGRADARVVLMPLFEAGGRVTVDDVHYLVRDRTAVPVADTEYARDASFGYRESDLGAWVRERAGGVRGTVSLDLATIRRGGPDAVAGALARLGPGDVAIANGTLDRDADVVAAGILLAEHAGVPLVARSAADLVRARAGQPVHGLLAAADLAVGAGPGLVVVGSHVPATTRQLARLLAEPPAAMDQVELDAGAAGDEARSVRAAGAAIASVTAILAAGRTAVVATSRAPLVEADPAAALARAARISTALVEIVRGVRRRPGWVLAKGGITSSDVATRGLRVRVATVVGQLRPGVPVWRTGPESRWPGVPLVVFPGNVGGDDDLRAVVEALAEAGRSGTARR